MDKHTVYEVADILQTSHTTIYKKLNNKEVYKQLINCITKQGRHTYISLEGIEILKKHIQPKETVINDLETEVKKDDIQLSKTVDVFTLETFINSLETNNKQLIESLTKQIESLQEDKLKLYDQLEIKDKQIAAKEENVSNLTRLLENSQVLLKKNQEEIFFLEDSHTNEQAKEKKSIWDIFKRN